MFSNYRRFFVLTQFRMISIFFVYFFLVSICRTFFSQIHKIVRCTKIRVVNSQPLKNRRTKSIHTMSRAGAWECPQLFLFFCYQFNLQSVTKPMRHQHARFIYGLCLRRSMYFTMKFNSLGLPSLVFHFVSHSLSIHRIRFVCAVYGVYLCYWHCAASLHMYRHNFVFPLWSIHR